MPQRPTQSTSQQRTEHTLTCPCSQHTCQQHNPAHTRQTLPEPSLVTALRAKDATASASLAPCIGSLPSSLYRGCMSPQDTLGRRQRTWTQCWCCTCLPGTLCMQQLTWTQSDHCRYRWDTAGKSRWTWRRCWSCTCQWGMLCKRRGRWKPCWSCTCPEGKVRKRLRRRLNMSLMGRYCK